MIDVEAGSDFTIIQNCDFGFAETETDEFVSGITVNAATGTIIRGNDFFAGAQGTVNGIELTGARQVVIEDNYLIGNYSTANIHGVSTLSTEVLIQYNTLWNGVESGLNTEPVIQLLTGTTAISRWNTGVCNETDAAAAFVGDGTFNFTNMYNETVGGASTGWLIGVATNTGGSITVTVD